MGGAGRLERGRCIAAYSRATNGRLSGCAQWRCNACDAANIPRTSNGTSSGLCRWWMRLIWQVFNVILCQLILGWCQRELGAGLLDIGSQVRLDGLGFRYRLLCALFGQLRLSYCFLGLFLGWGLCRWGCLFLGNGGLYGGFRGSRRRGSLGLRKHASPCLLALWDWRGSFRGLGLGGLGIVRLRWGGCFFGCSWCLLLGFGRDFWNVPCWRLNGGNGWCTGRAGAVCGSSSSASSEAPTAPVSTASTTAADAIPAASYTRSSTYRGRAIMGCARILHLGAGTVLGLLNLGELRDIAWRRKSQQEHQWQQLHRRKPVGGSELMLGVVRQGAYLR
jgi:hypothetical protein